MDATREKSDVSNIYSTGRRSAISTSELGLYSDYSDRYKTDTYSSTIRKLVIGIVVVVSVILIGIFLYDFASSASISSKISQETKHIYILQNSLRKAGYTTTKKPLSMTLPPTIYIVNTSNATLLEDRSDDVQNVEFKNNNETENPMSTEAEPLEDRMMNDEPELRMQNLQNFKIRSKLLDLRRQQDGDDEDNIESDNNRMMENHAMNYRIPGASEPNLDNKVNEETRRAVPFRFERQGPHPASFKRPRYPQLTQYRYPQASRNIQDIIKYLAEDPGSLNRGFKFTGFYVNPKKYDGSPDIGVVAMNSDRSEEEQQGSISYPVGTDPLYQYKPKHPTDVNLLATSNFRFSPAETQRYNPYYDKYYQRPSTTRAPPSLLPSSSSHQNTENHYESAYPSHVKKRKPKPFSVMLDIYPITDDQTQKVSRPAKPQLLLDEGDSRVPFGPYVTPPPKYPRLYVSPTPILMHNQHQSSDDDERHQMILHLNLYPKKKNKPTRNEIIDRSHNVPEAMRDQLISKIIPFDTIAKHLTDHAAVEEARFHEEPSLRYEETVLAKEGDVDENQTDKFIDSLIDDSKNGNVSATLVPGGTKNTMATVKDVSTTSTETIIVVEDTSTRKKYHDNFTDIDTVEGFQRFADSLIALD